MTIKLRKADEKLIKKVLRADIELTIAGLKRFLRKSTWVGKTNRYGLDAIKHLKIQPPNTPLRMRNLAQYVAASAVLHVNDGLGRPWP